MMSAAVPDRRERCLRRERSDVRQRLSGALAVGGQDRHSQESFSRMVPYPSALHNQIDRSYPMPVKNMNTPDMPAVVFPE